MTGEDAAVADSASGSETATGDAGQAGEQADATHGDAAEATESGTEATRADTSEESTDSDDDDDASEESAEGLTEEEQQSKAAKRRERRREREEQRITKAVEERLAKQAADRKVADAAKEREAKTSEAVKARQEKLAAYLGTQETNAALQAEVDTFATQLAALTNDPEYDQSQDKIDEAKRIASQLSAKRGELARRYENNQMSDLLWQDVWGTIESGFVSAAQFPELAKDPKAQARYLKADGGIEGALKVLRETIRSAVITEKDAEIAAVKKSSKAELDAMTQEAKAWRQRAGGSELDGVGAGAPATSPGVLTPDRYAALSYEDRQKLRSTPEGRRQIDEMARGRTGFGQRSA